MSDGIMKGEITKQYTVWCGGETQEGYQCSIWYQACGPMPYFQQQAKFVGWKKTKARGWLCPHHAK